MSNLTFYKNTGKFPHFQNDFFQSFFDMGDLFGSTSFRIDVTEKEDAYLMEAELPGIKKDDITITISEDTLSILAQREEQSEHCLYSERRSGKFQRNFSISNVKENEITATYQDGILTLILPKKEQNARSNECHSIPIH